VRPQGLTRRLLLAGAAAAAVVAADLLTKRLAATSFVRDPVTVIPGVLTFTYTENPGAAFSLFQNAGTFLGLAAFVALGIVAGALRNARRLVEVVAFGLIAGGAVGNLVDRIGRGPGLLDGRVIDWIQFPNFPVFNLADSSLTVGVVLLLLFARARSAGAPEPAQGTQGGSG
jgi:signal peptidase II